MKKKILVGLIGDHDATVLAHQAIPIALENAGASACSIFFCPLNAALSTSFNDFLTAC